MLFPTKLNKKDILSMIQELAAVRAPAGLERKRCEAFKRLMTDVLKDKDVPIKTDEFGNYFVHFKGTSGKKAIAILAHVDEIGGVIRKIKKHGRLEFSRRGGYEGRWLISRHVEILNNEGKWINGVIGGRSAHSTPDNLRIKEKIDPLELEIFIGASSKEEVVKDYGLHVGAPFVFSGPFGLLNPAVNDDVIAGYSMDNLAALTSLILIGHEIVNHLLTDFGSVKSTHDIYLVATSREEIGTEGAYQFARHHSIDKVIGIDIGLVADFKGAVTSDIKLHGGPVIIWQEGRGSGVMDYDMCRSLVKIAESNELPYQNGVVEFYGSDAGKAQKWLGIPSALIGIPTMYSHNVPEICTLGGIKAAAGLIFSYLKSLK